MTLRALTIFALCGPVTGGLLALALHLHARGRWACSALCVAGIVVFYVGAPMVLGVELNWLGAHR